LHRSSKTHQSRLAEVQKKKAEREEKRAKLLGMLKRGSTHEQVGDQQQRRSSTTDNSKKVIGASSRLYPGPGKKQLSAAMLEQQRKDREQNERLASLSMFPEVPKNRVALQPTVATLMMPHSLMAQRNMGMMRNPQRTMSHTGRGGGSLVSSGMPILGMNNNQRFLQATSVVGNGGLGGSAIRSVGMHSRKQRHQQRQQAAANSGYCNYDQNQQPHNHHQYQQQPPGSRQQYQQVLSYHQRQHSAQSLNDYHNQPQQYNTGYLLPQHDYQQLQKQQQQQQFAQHYYARSQFYYQKQSQQQQQQKVWKPH
jgi:hypothetical protein